MSDLYYAVGDQPVYAHQLIEADGTAANLTGKTVKFICRKTERHTKAHTELINADATLDPATQGAGWASYAITPTDAAALVEDDNYYYEVRWRAFAGSVPLSYPNDGWMSLAVS